MSGSADFAGACAAHAARHAIASPTQAMSGDVVAFVTGQRCSGTRPGVAPCPTTAATNAAPSANGASTGRNGGEAMAAAILCAAPPVVITALQIAASVRGATERGGTPS